MVLEYLRRDRENVAKKRAEPDERFQKEEDKKRGEESGGASRWPPP